MYQCTVNILLAWFDQSGPNKKLLLGHRETMSFLFLFYVTASLRSDSEPFSIGEGSNTRRCQGQLHPVPAGGSGEGALDKISDINILLAQ